jgi:hypothetical protein
VSIKDSLEMTRDMGKEYLDGKMGRLIMELGQKANSME